jgi:DNA polymerase-3 subunit delta'
MSTNSFGDIIGHHRQVGILQRLMAREAIPHALCLTGPGGIGKKRIALALAKALLCKNGTPCHECTVCRKFDLQQLSDFSLVAAEGKPITVEMVRDMTAKLPFRPFEARSRVIVMDDADAMNEAAANAFLKNLEEPPSYVFFILVTASFNTLLPTIRSRCQTLRFQGLTEQDKAQILQRHFGIREASLAEQLATISLSQLYTKTEDLEAFHWDVKDILAFCSAIIDNHFDLSLAWWEKLADKSLLPLLLERLLLVLLLLAKMQSGRPLPSVMASHHEPMQKLADSCDAGALTDLMTRVMTFQHDRKRNLNPVLFFQDLLTTGLGRLAQARRQQLLWQRKKSR